MADTAQGATITFGTSGYSEPIIEISAWGRNRAVIDTSHLGLAAGSEMTSIPDDLIEIEEVSFRVQHDPNEQFPITGAAETITITFPIPSGQSNGATIAGTGFATRDGQPDMQIGQLMIAEHRFKFDGLTGPTFTDSS